MNEMYFQIKEGLTFRLYDSVTSALPKIIFILLLVVLQTLS